jgi:hypothetical protein
MESTIPKIDTFITRAFKKDSFIQTKEKEMM